MSTVTLNLATDVMKNVYLGVINEQLNTSTSPFFNMIAKGSEDIAGNSVNRAASYGLNGGIGATSEDGTLPAPYGNGYVVFKQSLANLFGNVQISDKAIRASKGSSGAFVNLLNAEIDGLIKSSKFNLNRMLYGTGEGVLGVVSEAAISGATSIAVSNTQNFSVGQVVDIYSGTTVKSSSLLIASVSDSGITFSSGITSALSGNEKVYIQGSKGLEMDGLGTIFDTSATTLYGVTKAANAWLAPQTKDLDGSISISALQEMFDKLEVASGVTPNLLLCSYAVRRGYLTYMDTNRMHVDVMNLDGGFKALSYNGVPMVADRFCPAGTIYYVNTDDFKLHQLGDWSWLEGAGGTILRQREDKAVYNATLVKYANLMCLRPTGVGKIFDIT